MRRLLCMLLALTMLFSTTALAAEEPAAPEAEETAQERRTNWTPSQAILEFIANQEGFRSMPHKSGGHWYVGFGTQIKAGQYSGGISREAAMALLKEDVDGYAWLLNSYLAKNGIAVTQNEFDALLSLTCNLSTVWMKSDYRLSRCLIDGAEQYSDVEIVNAFGSWSRAGGRVLPGLARRRIAEAKIFLYGDYDIFNYTYYYAPDEDDLRLTALLAQLEELEAQLLDGAEDSAEEGTEPVDEAALEAEIEALRLEITALEAEIEAANATEVRGPSYPGGVPVDYTYVRYDAGEGSTDTTLIYYREGEPYGALAEATRAGYRLAAWETEDGERLLPTDVPTRARAVEAVWTTGAVDYRNLAITPFSDVPASAWYFDELEELTAKGVISGYGDGSFRPTDTVSCGAVLKLLLLAAGYPQQTPTGANSLSGYLTLVQREGFVQAGEITDLRAAASRLLVARLAARVLKLTPSDAATPYADVDDPAATALYAAGVMQGKTVNGARVLDAGSGVKRSEMTAVVWRMMQLVPAGGEESIS